MVTSRFAWPEAAIGADRPPPTGLGGPMKTSVQCRDLVKTCPMTESGPAAWDEDTDYRHDRPPLGIETTSK